MRCAAQQLAHGRFVALTDLECGAWTRRTCWHPRRARPPASRLRPPSLTTRSISSGTAKSANFHDPAGALPPLAGSTTWASPATPTRRSSSARPMHEPSPRDTSTSPATAEAASSPILTIVSAIDLEAQAPQHQLDAHRRRGRAGTTRSSPRARRRGRSPAAARSRRRRRARPARSATIAPRMSVAAAGRRRLELQAGHLRQRVDVGGADDVADLHQRARRRSRSRPRRPAGRTSAPRRAGVNSSSTDAGISPTMPRTTPVYSASGSPIVPTASAIGQHGRGRDGDVHAAPEHARQGPGGLA